jgi:hypothetical protein
MWNRILVRLWTGFEQECCLSACPLEFFTIKCSRGIVNLWPTAAPDAFRLRNPGSLLSWR